MNLYHHIERIRVIVVIAVCGLFLANSIHGEEQTVLSKSFFKNPDGRSLETFRAEGKKGMVVCAHEAASKAGAAVLQRGGNAVDAAVAASFVVSVARPQSHGDRWRRVYAFS